MKQNTQVGNENTTEFLNVHERLKEYAAANVFGADFDPFPDPRRQMNMVLAGDGRGHIYNINSLEFPLGHLADLPSAKKEIPLGSVDIIATNPPFGSDIPITDKHILEHYELAHAWEPDGEGGFRNTGTPKGSVAPEILFIERCIKWLKPGTGAWASFCPMGFSATRQLNTSAGGSCAKPTCSPPSTYRWKPLSPRPTSTSSPACCSCAARDEEEKRAEALGGIEEYPVFMAVADKVGFDRRGNKLYKRTPDGEEIVEPKQHTERIRIGGRFVERVP